jgi:hypothetical protein
LRSALGWLLLIYSFLFHFVLALFLLGLAYVPLSAGAHNLKLGMLPWEGRRLTYWVLTLGVAGLLCVFLAVTRIFRFVFPFWTLLILILMFRGFFLSSYTFSGAAGFRVAAWLVFGAFVAFIGSLSLFRRRRDSRLLA